MFMSDDIGGQISGRINYTMLDVDDIREAIEQTCELLGQLSVYGTTPGELYDFTDSEMYIVAIAHHSRNADSVNRNISRVYFDPDSGADQVWSEIQLEPDLQDGHVIVLPRPLLIDTPGDIMVYNNNGSGNTEASVFGWVVA